MSAISRSPLYTGSIRIPLTQGWQFAMAPEPATPATLNNLRFLPAHVPGTAASSLRAQGAWSNGDAVHFDAAECWFRCAFDAESAAAGEEIILEIAGIATLSDVWLNGEQILTSDSMFRSHKVDVSSLIRQRNELLIACRPLASKLREYRRQQPALRWRTRVVSEQQLRWFRTTILGRAPGFAREPAPVGPWRPITLLRNHGIVIEEVSRQATLEESAGKVTSKLGLRVLRPGLNPVSGRLHVGERTTSFAFHESGDRIHGVATLGIPAVTRWWPHTHGEPALYPVRIEVTLADGTTSVFNDVPVGFRDIDPGFNPPGDSGLALKINGTAVFARGVVWTPCDPVSLAAPENDVRRRLLLLRDAGFNLIRLAGTSVYEDERFHRACDELGLMVWQDMMFANMDYPFEDRLFSETVRAEAAAELSRLSRHPSTTLICGNSEIEQQVGMLGLDPAIGRPPFFSQQLPEITASCCPGVPYVPSAPCGGDMPFRSRTGVANYFGVGAYLRPLEDTRRAEVRFASECLAFSNVPEPEAVDQLSLSVPGGISPTHPIWKRGVPRDSGASWDFEDVRDHYLKLLYSVEPLSLRYADAARYWELSRVVSGEVMAEVFGEWRRAESPCAGGIVLWSADLEPGAGWGILDSQGMPKAAYWFLKRALAPCALWTTDEGIDGVDIYAANDRPAPLSASLRVALYRDGEQRVAAAERALVLPGNSTTRFGVEEILGRFVDASYAYRFGPPGHDLIAVGLYSPDEEIPLAQTFRSPAGRTMQRMPVSEFCLTAEGRVLPDQNIEVLITSRRFMWGVRVAAPGFLPDDAYFGLEPGITRRIVLTLHKTGQAATAPVITAVNVQGRMPVTMIKAS